MSRDRFSERKWAKLRDRYLCRQPVEPFWSMQEETLNGRSWVNLVKRLGVIQSIDHEADGHLWLHTSVSREDHAIPTYDELALVKRLFIGEDRMALQLFVRQEEHVNLHPGCLHLWTPVEHRPVPDFRRELVPGVWQV